MLKQKWNDEWLFWEDRNSFALIWDIPGHAAQVTLPHDPMIYGKAHAESASGNDGGYRDGGSYVYCRCFTPDESWVGKQVELTFGGVMRSAMIYLNNQRLITVPYGYSGFTVDLSDYLMFGRLNILRVVLRTADLPNSRWYSGAGIFRDVWLSVGEPVYISDVKISTLSVYADTALLEAEVLVKSVQNSTAQVTIEGTVSDASGAEKAAFREPIYLDRSGSETVTVRLAVSNPKLWSGRDPNLYTCRVHVGGDSEEVRFGIRTVTADSVNGLLVNGTSVKLRGACIHHDNGILGAVSYDESEYRRIALMKAAGFNAIRSSHQPLSENALRACDELGMYVMDEAFDCWTRSKKDYDYAVNFDAHWEDDVRAMVEKDYNHPSVIMYSLGNEIPEIATDHGAMLGRRMYRFVKMLDRSRLTLACINGVFASGDRLSEIVADVTGASGSDGDSGNVNTFMAVTATHADEIAMHRIIGENLEKAGVNMDLIGYNYMTARYEQDGKAYPNRVIVGSETYPPEIGRNWEIIKMCSHVIGDFTWTGWDYIGEAGVGIPAYTPGEGSFGAQYPCQLAYCGDFDLTGRRRPASYYREIVFGLRNEPYITVQNPYRYGQPALMTPWIISDSQASWNYCGMEGKPVLIEVYAPGTEAELFCNGVSLGRKPVERCRVLFDTVYTPGVLEAVSYESGKVIGRSTLCTTGEAVSVKAEVEPNYSGDNQMKYVRITLTDHDGNCVPDHDVRVSASVSGGTLLGLGSGNPKPLTGYTDGESETFLGAAQAILRKGEGETVLTVRADGFSPVMITI